MHNSAEIEIQRTSSLKRKEKKKKKMAFEILKHFISSTVTYLWAWIQWVKPWAFGVTKL